jgi:F0F1-type ATP synthase membrane subunit c/vacuolar-type H+-ATPase subunit K
VHQWPVSRDGHDLDFQVTSVRIDGRAAPYVTERENDTLLLRTTLAEVLTGTLDVQLDYTVETAATAAEQDGKLVDRVRWVALLEGWKYGFTWGDADEFDPFRIELRVSEELAELATAGGWISQDTKSAERASDWEDSVVPFGSVAPENSRELTKSADGILSHSLEPKPNKLGAWPLYLTIDDLGTSMDFPVGTFTEPDPDALRWSQFVATIPVISVITLAALAFGIAAAGAHQGLARRRRVFEKGLLRDLVWWLAPAAALATTILFVWITGDMPAYDRTLEALGWPTLAAIVACVAALVLTRSKHRPER